MTVFQPNGLVDRRNGMKSFFAEWGLIEEDYICDLDSFHLTEEDVSAVISLEHDARSEQEPHSRL